MLSNKAIKLLAKSLAPEVAAGIFESEQWVTFCHEVIPDLITEIAGEMHLNQHQQAGASAAALPGISSPAPTWAARPGLFFIMSAACLSMSGFMPDGRPAGKPAAGNDEEGCAAVAVAAVLLLAAVLVLRASACLAGCDAGRRSSLR